MRKIEPYLLQPYNSGGSEPYGSTAMAPHPMSDARLAEGLVMQKEDATGTISGEPTGLKKLFGLRKITQALPSSSSISYVSQIDPNRTYKSFETLSIDKRKHFRPAKGPRDRFDRQRPPLTSHEIGWFAEEKPLRKPIYPICSSAMTKFFDNMAQMSHMKKR